MTVGGWILFAFVAFCALGTIIWALSRAKSKSTKIVVAALALAVLIGTLLIQLWYYGSTEEGQRALKTQESNFGGGIRRTVRVYDMEGDLIEEYSGEFDIETREGSILFDDEEGKRHIIYYSTGTIIVDEE